MKGTYWDDQSVLPSSICFHFAIYFCVSEHTVPGLLRRLRSHVIAVLNWELLVHPHTKKFTAVQLNTLRSLFELYLKRETEAGYLSKLVQFLEPAQRRKK